MSRHINQTVNFDAGGAILAYRIVSMGTADNQVVQSSGATDGNIGVGPEYNVSAGEPCDVHFRGIAEVEYGGTVPRDALVTADASGRGISTSTAGNRIVGIALKAGVTGDIGRVLIAQGSV